MIHVEARPGVKPVPREMVERAVRAALEQQGAQGDLTVVLTDDAQLHELNRAYLGVDAPTDVLSFPASETDPDSGAHYLGDILISVPRAASQAAVAGHPLEAEVQLLAVHGVLHLLGHDHAQPSDKAVMWKAQGGILEAIGLAGLVIRET
jgi:probable rRNA maturation factor